MKEENPTKKELLNKIKSLEDELAILKKNIINEINSKRYLKPEDILITANSKVISINENVTFTATFPGLDSKTVSFYNGSDLLGTAITNNNGVASLTTSFDEARVASIHAVCEDMISEPYTIKVGIFVYINSSETALTTDNLNSNNLEISGDFVLEFDIKQTNTSGQIKIVFDGRNYTVTSHMGISHSNGALISYREGASDGHHYLRSLSTPYNKWYHLKMTRKDSIFTWHVDDVLMGMETLSTLGAEKINTLKGLKPNNGVGIVKNLVVYPI